MSFDGIPGIWRNSTRWNLRSSRLGRKIFTSSLWMVFTISMISTLASVLISSKNARYIQRDQIFNVIEKLSPSLSHAAWNINDTSVQIILDAISNQPGVAVASFQGDLQLLASPASQGVEYANWSCDEIIYRDLKGTLVGESKLPNGELRVCVAQNISGHRFASTFLSLALPQLIAILLTSLGFLWITQRLVISRINLVSSHLMDDQENSRREPIDDDDELAMLDHALIEKTQNLRSERDINNLVIENINKGIILTDGAFRILRTNHALEDLFPIPFGSQTPSKFDEIVPTIGDMKTDTWHKVDNLVFDKGSERHVEAYRTKVKLPNREEGNLFVFHDLTGLKNLEQQTIQAQKMSAIGAVTGGIAHDFNNILAVIFGNCEIALRQNNLSEETRNLITQTQSSARRGASLVDKLLTFSRRQKFRKRAIDPEEVIDTIIEMAQTMIGPTIALHKLHKAKSWIQVDPTYLESALLNLIINSRDASPSNGEIWLETVDEKHNNKAMVRLSVIDNGRGIDPVIIDRVQEPFFTTKKKHHGTGLGLSMVGGFAEQSGGTLEITSKPGRTQVSILLPAISKDKLPAHKKRAPVTEVLPDALMVDQQLKGLRIAVIDDEQKFADLVSMHLNYEGAQASPFYSLDLLLKCGDLSQFDLFVCDVMLFGETGVDVWVHVNARYPKARFIFMSGNVPIELKQVISKTGAIVLSKPFALAKLTEAALLTLHKSEEEA